jgi:hypothetical protein
MWALFHPLKTGVLFSDMRAAGPSEFSDFAADKLGIAIALHPRRKPRVVEDVGRRFVF